MAMFYPDDTCVLKEDPTILAIVERTSYDVDDEPFYELLDWLPNPKVPKHLVDSFKKSGVPPKDHVTVNFVEPHHGFCLLHENDLKLVNRAFVIGDVVKKRTSDAISGFVARTSIECTLLPVYPGLELRNEAVWPPRKDRILRRIPGEELRHHEDFYEGDYVIYHGWVGVVNSVFEDVTIRLSDGSVVSVENSEEVLVPALKSGQRKQAIRAIDATRGFAWLVHTLSVLREQGKGDDPAACFYPGQRVVTKKTNLRRGNWKFGAYNANVAPKGIVVNVQESGIKVTWLASNVYNRDRDDLEPPPEYLADDELGSGEVRAYNNERLSSQTDVSVGTMKGSSLMSGDHVKFEDIAGAAVKYSEGSEHGSEHGILRRIPRTETRGYDMNVYLVRETNMKLLIHWQDGSKSEEEAKNVVPYLNSDEHEVWPGKIVAIEANESAFTQTDASMTSNEFLKPSRVGIVQSTNARERTAIVRWFAEPRVQILNSPDSVLIPGSTLGTLSDEHSEVSYFEIISYPALAKLRGDLVLIAPEQGPQVQENEVCERPSGRMIEYFSSTFNNLRNHFPSSITSSVNETLTPRPGRNSHDWFGTIVDLGLDGILTVRLGALDVIKDVKVPIERVTTLVEAGADAAFFETMSMTEEEMDEEMADEDDWSGSDDSTDSEHVIEESVEYEGGRRLSADGGDDMWMTDEDDYERPISPLTVTEAEKVVALANEVPSSIVNNDLSSGRPQFSQFSNMPSKFAILDEAPPVSLHYISSPVSLNANLMRRIRKEHKILQSSLPEGIWVRTWADRLDLIRVLIIGAETTPYNLAPFVIDFQFPEEFPKVPPNAHFHSWTNGLGRINPNLYEDGKICLSLLGTWSGEGKNEEWSETGSSMLQVIVSLLGLVLVKEPYYNEAGYEALAGSQDYKLSALQYSERVVVMSKGFIVHALSYEIAGLSDILAWLYKSSARQGPELLKSVIDDAVRILRYSERARKREELEAQNTKEVDAMHVDEVEAKPRRLSSGAMVMLRKYIQAMEGSLEKGGFEATKGQHEDSSKGLEDTV